VRSVQYVLSGATVEAEATAELALEQKVQEARARAAALEEEKLCGTSFFFLNSMACSCIWYKVLLFIYLYFFSVCLCGCR
jgi:hypothetical protein